MLCCFALLVLLLAVIHTMQSNHNARACLYTSYPKTRDAAGPRREDGDGDDAAAGGAKSHVKLQHIHACGVHCISECGGVGELAADDVGYVVCVMVSWYDGMMVMV